MYTFGEFVLDPQLYQLRRADQVVPLEPKVFDVLRYLIEHSDRVATKRELLESLWPHEVVTEAVLPTNINALRRALGQKRGDKWPIETVHGRGYRFSMPVTRTLLPPALEGSGSLLPGARLEAGDSTPSYVGQSALLDKLRKLLDQALLGHAQICVLSGEAGIGKSRTAHHLAELAHERGADVWMGSCEELTGLPPLSVFQQILRAALVSEGAETLRRWLGLHAADLPSVLPGLAEPRVSAPLRDQESFHVFDALVRVVSQASRVRPRVIWLEDMHRADEASWQLLRMLAPYLERAAVLVVVTVRSRDDLTAVLSVQRNLDLLQRLPICHRLVLRGLDAAEVSMLAEELVGREITPELARALHEKTGGNPLFVRELVEWLEARGRVDAETLSETPHLAPPEMVRHVLRRRVLRLGPSAQKMLEAAAVLGVQWSAQRVEQIVKLPHELFCDELDAALAQRTIVQLPGLDQYRFGNELLRDTLYTDLSTRERRRLHLACASVLEPRVAWQGLEGVRDVAQHLYAALPDGDVEHAIAWLERAAKLCEDCGAYREAALHYRHALDAARLLPLPSAALSEALSVHEERLASLARSSRAHS